MSNFSFGAPPATTSNFSFGAMKPTMSAPPLGAQAAAPPAFGAQTTAPPAFGVPSAAPPAFGTPTTAAPAFGLQAGAPPAFGAQAVAPPAFGTPTTAAPAFGAQTMASAAPATNFSFGPPAVTSAPAFSFGTTTAATSAGQTVPTLGGLGGGTFSFAQPKPAPISASLNFGTTTTSTTSFSLPAPTGGGLGMFAKPATTTLTSAVPATAPTPFYGLGGIDVTASQPKAGDSKQDVKVKETQVPDEIAKTVEALKMYIKTQKTISSDIGRTSTSKLSNVSGEIMNLQWSLQNIANTVETNYNHIKLLRKETSKTIQSVEMAQRTQDTPAGLQYENSTPFQYFQSLVAKYEQDLINFRQQIALTERHMQSITSPQTVSPEDLNRGFQQLNESFISLAGRLHEIHQKVEVQKEQFLNLRKYRLRDSTNVFAKIDNPPEIVEEVSRVINIAGPTPFSNISSFGKTFGNTATSGSSTNPQVAK